MRVWVSVDMEGIAGVMHRDHTVAGGREYEVARVWMTEEVNAVVEGCFQGGATEVVVADGHGNCRNILRDRLDPRARLIAGQFSSLPPTQVSGLHAGFDAAMLVGYHARAGLAPGNLDHTAWSQTVTDVTVNGRPVGEAELVAAYAGTLGVPTVLVSGDDVLGRDIETSMPDVLAVVVKRALGRYQTELVARDEVHRRLRSGAERALRRASTVKPFAFPSPIRLQVTFTHPGFADLAAWVPGTTRVEPDVVAYESDDFSAVFSAFTLMCATTGVAYYQQLPK
ncbi:MAG: M55 family metallopeptidase [Armatimonadota bacterium]|nr:M55 family metallopeptidase [Armatimonadota bacterium]MDR7573794.1 M55 family metallopeptidase [Armatimonadota bacterium]